MCITCLESVTLTISILHYNTISRFPTWLLPPPLPPLQVQVSWTDKTKNGFGTIIYFFLLDLSPLIRQEEEIV